MITTNILIITHPEARWGGAIFQRKTVDAVNSPVLFTTKLALLIHFTVSILSLCVVTIKFNSEISF